MADLFSQQLASLAAEVVPLADKIPPVYYGENGSTPTQTSGGLSPLQLALMAAMTTGNPPAFGINPDFLKELKKFSDSGRVPANVIYKDIVGAALLSLGDDLYLLRNAQDCGPDGVNRSEQVLVGKRTDIAFGTFAHYGGKIDSGTLCEGTGVYTPPDMGGGSY